MLIKVYLYFPVKATAIYHYKCAMFHLVHELHRRGPLVIPAHVKHVKPSNAFTIHCIQSPPWFR